MTDYRKVLVQLWRYEKMRFLVIGGVNTVFSFALFSGLYYLLAPAWHYLSILTVSFTLSTSVAFLLMKVFVFRSPEAYGAEYIKCILIYSLNFLVNAGLLHILVSQWGLNVILAQFVATAWMVIQSYYGHKYFSFRMEAV